MAVNCPNFGFSFFHLTAKDQKNHLIFTNYHTMDEFIGNTPRWSPQVRQRVKMLSRDRAFWSTHRTSPFPEQENEDYFMIGMPVLFDQGYGFVIGHTATKVDIVLGPIFGPFEDISFCTAATMEQSER